MSKASTKETEEEAELPDALNALPRGAKNYITPQGMERLRDEFTHLKTVERPQIVELSYPIGSDRNLNCTSFILTVVEFSSVFGQFS